MRTIALIISLFLFQYSSFATCNDSTWMAKLGMKKIYESDIAQYYALERDSDFVEQLDSSLQVNIERLTAKFNHRIDATIRIQIFPTVNITTCVCGKDTTVVYENCGCTQYRKINLSSRYDAKADSIYHWRDATIIVIHEYAHAITIELVGLANLWKMPQWLREGLACHAETIPYYPYTQIMKTGILKKIDAKKNPKVKQLSLHFEEVKYGYVWSYYFSEYLVQKHGWNTLLDLMRDYEHFPKNIGMTYRQLDEEWVKYLKDKPIASENQ